MNNLFKSHTQLLPNFFMPSIFKICTDPLTSFSIFVPDRRAPSTLICHSVLRIFATPVRPIPSNTNAGHFGNQGHNAVPSLIPR